MKSSCKVKMLAAAVVCTSFSAHAQSSLELFGVIDLMYNYGRGSIANRQQLLHSGNSGTRIGFKGSEALGGGWSAGFWLEAGVMYDSGIGFPTNTNNQISGAGGANGLTFNRRSTVSLSGPFGEVRLGRDFVPSYNVNSNFDPFFNQGVGAALPAFLGAPLASPTGIRASNSIAYFLPPDMGGIYGSAMIALGENLKNGAATQDDGNYNGMRLGYRDASWHFSIAAGKTRYAAGDIRAANAGAQYTWRGHKFMAAYFDDSIAGIRGKGVQGGVDLLVGPGQIRASYSGYKSNKVGNPKSQKLALGYVYNLSKRTALYTTVAYLSNKGSGAAASTGALTGVGRSSSGLDVGVRHEF